MNRNIISTLFILLTLTGTGWSQSLMAVQEVKMQPKNKFYNTSDSTIVFPQFIGSPFTQKINSGLLDYLKKYEDDSSHISVLQILESLRDDGLGESFYKTFYSKNTISLRLWMAWYGGAHPNYTNDYLTFSTLTGNRLTLDSLFIMQGASALQKIISKKQEEYISNYKREMLKLGYETHNDSSKFEGAVEYAKKYCFNDFKNRDFIIDKNSIRINVVCGFPPNGKPLAPSGDLIIEKNSIGTVLKKDYLK
ncbi:MAG: hypothetical protein JXR26_10445 [Balneolaceae bacterium]|nr:hypothetical protein [Balneolaceae bacterium]